MGILGELFSGVSKPHRSYTERYTKPTWAALEFAREEAARRGASEFTAADLLAGLSSEEGSRANRVGKLKENAFYLRWLAGLPALPAVEPLQGETARIETGIRPGIRPGIESAIEPDWETRRALAFAVLEADRDREYWIDSDHVLRGLLRFPNKADFALLKTELSLSAARVASRKDREEFLPEQNPSLKVVRYLVRKYILLLAPSLLSLVCYLIILFEEFGIAMTPVAH